MRRRAILALCAALMFLPSCNSALLTHDVKMAKYLRDRSVMVVTDSGSGSATVFKATVRGKVWAFILGANHVTEKAPVVMVRRPTLDGYSEALAYRLHDNSELDVSVYVVVDQRWNAGVHSSPSFAAHHVVPGQTVHHVGSFLGEAGFQSYAKGKVSFAFRELPGLGLFHQLTATAYPGSSGGGVFDDHGCYVGMLVRGIGSDFNFITPGSFLEQWLHDNHFGFMVDGSALSNRHIKEVNKAVKLARQQSELESGVGL